MRHTLLFLISLASLAVAPTAQARTFYGSEYETSATKATVLPMAHLPTWVQVTAGSGSRIYTTDSGSMQVSQSRLKPFTFLRVLEGGLSRLHVDVYSDGGRPVQSGWVEADGVVPSAAGTDWLVTSKSAPLYRAADAADGARVLDRFTPLQAMAPATAGRVLVRVYNAEFTAIDQGWVDASQTGIALAPQMRVPSTDQTQSLRRLDGPLNQSAFLRAASDAARAAARTTGVPASVTVAQAILESDWGRSSLSQDAQNYFGMKVMGTLGNDGAVWLPTSEYDADGNLYRTVSAFRAYKSLTDSLLDHDRLLQQASRYAGAMQVADDPRQFAVQLYESGYSTDPAYPDKLVALMDSYNLYRLDG